MKKADKMRKLMEAMADKKPVKKAKNQEPKKEEKPKKESSLKKKIKKIVKKED